MPNEKAPGTIFSSVNSLSTYQHFSSTYTKTGTVQMVLVWLLCKDNTK